MFLRSLLAEMLLSSLYVLVLVQSLLNSVRAQVIYKSLLGKDCVADAYRQVLFGLNSIEDCSLYCTLNNKCLSFKMSDKDCHLFVYTKTSHRVNKEKKCAVSVEIIWVKEDSYKECSVGFGDEFYGTKYKLVSAINNQSDAIAHCQALGDFSRLADSLDHEELSHLVNISGGIAGDHVCLDGSQILGSPEPSGGWKWRAAGVNLDHTMWNSLHEPNNGGSNGGLNMLNEQAILLHVPAKKLADYPASHPLQLGFQLI